MTLWPIIAMYTCGMCPGLCLQICVLPPLQTCRRIISGRAINILCEGEKERLSLIVMVMPYLNGGEEEASPVLPSDEVERLASKSAPLPSTSGGVLGTRSGLPDCMPEKKQHNMEPNYCKFHHRQSTAMKEMVQVFFWSQWCLSPYQCHPLILCF